MDKKCFDRCSIDMNCNNSYRIISMWTLKAGKIFDFFHISDIERQILTKSFKLKSMSLAIFWTMMKVRIKVVHIVYHRIVYGTINSKSIEHSILYIALCFHKSISRTKQGDDKRLRTSWFIGSAIRSMNM